MTEKEQKHEILRRTIRKQLIVCGYSLHDLALMLHISLASVYNKLKNPDTFTYRELRIVYDKLDITDEERLEML